MNRFERIQSLVQRDLQPLHLELENESSHHSVPPGSETHFKLLVVSDLFAGLSRVDRQRKVYTLFADEFKQGLHALTLRALTPEEWKAQSPDSFVSPECRGGSKHDKP